MKNKVKKSAKRNNAFTIVELLIVIVVIVILVGIITVSYGAIRRQAVLSVLYNSAESAANQMQIHKTLSGVNTFSKTLPETIKPDPKVGVAITDTNDDESFCLNVTHKDFDNLFVSIKNDEPVKSELCPGSVIDATVDYNYNAGIAADQRLVRKVCTEGYGFCVERNSDWSEISLTWSSNAEAVTYQIESRLKDASSWSIHNIGSNDPYTGSGSLIGGYGVSPSYSSAIRGSTTSLNWSSQATIPQPGTGREFRLRHVNANGTYGSWSSVLLEREPLPSVSNFKVTPDASWGVVTLSWSSVGEQDKYVGMYYQIESRLKDASSWSIHNIGSNDPYTGSGSLIGGYGVSPSYSSAIRGSTTSLNWSSQATIPQPGTAREFRIRTYTSNTGGSGGAEKVGEWATFMLERPALPTVNNFRVTPDSSWGALTLRWDSVGAAAGYVGMYYQIESRLKDATSWSIHSIGTSNPYTGNGGLIGGYGVSPSYSSGIRGSTTSLTWSSQTTIPQPGTAREFRIRTYTSNTGGSGGVEKMGEWSNFLLERDPLPTVSGFKVTPSSSWDAINLSWNSVGAVTGQVGMYYQIESRLKDATSWSIHSIGTSNPYTGNGGLIGGYGVSPSYSSGIRGSTTSLTWSSQTTIPQPGTAREFRIRTYTSNTGGSGGTEKVGEWSSFMLSR